MSVALDMREQGAANDLLDRLAADPRLGLTHAANSTRPWLTMTDLHRCWRGAGGRGRGGCRTASPGTGRRRAGRDIL